MPKIGEELRLLAHLDYLFDLFCYLVGVTKGMSNAANTENLHVNILGYHAPKILPDFRSSF